MILIRNAQAFAPEPLGLVDVLVAAERVLALQPAGSIGLPRGVVVDEVDLLGARLVPGLIDCHVHATGGGGESGLQSRVPPLMMSALTTAGVTSCVGVLGTDVTTRTMRDLVARTLGLRAEGLSAWCYTGGYAVPVGTLTGSVRDDIVFVDPIIGVGELAISDHRSSQPTFDEVVRIAADCHVAGMMTGKAGVLHLHMGDGPRGLALVRRALDEVEIPARVYHPTHVNRQRRLFEEAIALAARGCTVDVTAFDPGEDGIGAEDAIERWLDDGLPADRLTVSSDGAGCLPSFDADGVLVHMDVGRPDTVTRALQTLLNRGRSLQSVLPFFTTNVARLLRLKDKGHIAVGGSADLVVLDEQHRVSDVMARGRFVIRDGAVLVTGMFEGTTK